MKIALKCLFLVVVSGILFGCAGGQAVSLKDADNGKTIEMKVGQALKVSLGGNPTTGYNWYVASVDAAILQQAGEPGFKASSSALGAGGVITLSFQALKAGQTPLLLEYKRIWETGVPAIETYQVIVVVK
jgi:predicted secreted protein